MISLSPIESRAHIIIDFGRAGEGIGGSVDKLWIYREKSSHPQTFGRAGEGIGGSVDKLGFYREKSSHPHTLAESPSFIKAWSSTNRKFYENVVY